MNELLPLLAIETSGELCSAALMLDEHSFVEMNFLQKHIHSKKIISMIDSVLTNGEKDIKDVRAIAVSAGPGSFTGLRIGFSTAKGLAFGAGIPIIPVPTFDSLAFQISKNIIDDSKFIIANKASVEEIYAAKYFYSGGSVQIIEDVELINKDSFDKFTEGFNLFFGNTAGKLVHLNAASLAEWTYLFGKDLLTFDYDYIEPEYLGNPFVKKRKMKG